MDPEHMRLTMDEAEQAVQAHPIEYLEDVVLAIDRDNLHSFEVAAAQHIAREHRHLRALHEQFRSALRQFLAG